MIKKSYTGQVIQDRTANTENKAEIPSPRKNVLGCSFSEDNKHYMVLNVLSLTGNSYL